MAKTHAKIEDAIIISESQLSEKMSNYLLTTDEMIEEGKKIIELDSIQSMEKLDELIESYGAMNVQGIQDLAGYTAIVEGAKLFKKIRTATDNNRKRLTEPAIKYQKELIAYAKIITEKTTPVENHLLEQKQKFEDAKAEAERELFRKRREELLQNAYVLNGDEFVCGVLHVSVEELKNITDEMFDSYISHGKKELERIEAERVRKEQERAEMEREKEELRKERELLRAEREELRKELEELRAQKQATEKTYEIVEETKTETEPVTEVAVKEEIKPEVKIEPELNETTNDDLFNAGFECFRSLSLAAFRNPEIKKQRGEWIEFFENLVPEHGVVDSDMGEGDAF
jgi:DNA repair exonuclease SbcCD ATPase subunit